MNTVHNTAPARRNWPQKTDGQAGRENILVMQPPAEGGKTGIYTHLLSKPIEQAGETRSMAVFDFRSLRGRDFLAVESVVRSKRHGNTAPAQSGTFLLYLAAKAAGLDSELLEALPYRDYNRITTAALHFLLTRGLVDPCKWWRQQAFRMSKAAGGDVPYWLELTHDQFVLWIQDVNAAEKEDSEHMKRK